MDHTHRRVNVIMYNKYTCLGCVNLISSMAEIARQSFIDRSAFEAVRGYDETFTEDDRVTECNNYESYITTKHTLGGITYSIRKDNSSAIYGWVWRVVRRNGNGGEMACVAYNQTASADACLEYDERRGDYLFVI